MPTARRTGTVNRGHHIVSAILVVIAGMVATWAHHVAIWIRSYDRNDFNE